MRWLLKLLNHQKSINCWNIFPRKTKICNHNFDLHYQSLFQQKIPVVFRKGLGLASSISNYMNSLPFSADFFTIEIENLVDKSHSTAAQLVVSACAPAARHSAANTRNAKRIEKGTGRWPSPNSWESTSPHSSDLPSSTHNIILLSGLFWDQKLRCAPIKTRIYWKVLQNRSKNCYKVILVINNHLS